MFVASTLTSTLKSFSGLRIRWRLKDFFPASISEIVDLRIPQRSFAAVAANPPGAAPVIDSIDDQTASVHASATS